MPFGHKAGLPPSKKYLLVRQPRFLIKISGNVCEPFTSDIVDEDHRHFFELIQRHYKVNPCLLYTSDAADE